MSSKTDNTLLLPGARGWELWVGAPEKGFTCQLRSDVNKASELDKITSQRLVMGFPIREVLAVPFHVQTSDETMFADLAEMHLEKSNIRPEEGAGVLSDVFVANLGAADAQLLSVILSAPESDTMPAASPTGFDVSARFFPFEANSVTLWRELGRWGFAVTGSSAGQLSYFQSLSNLSLGEDAIRDVKLALMQLSMQGVNLQVNRVVLWLDGDELDPSEADVQTFRDHMEVEVTAVKKPNPSMPAELSALVPANVRAERRKQADKLKLNTCMGIAAILLIAAIAYFAYSFFTLKSDIADQQKVLEDVKMRHAGVDFFKSDWEQLAPVVDSKRWPLLLLERCTKLIPTGKDVRFNIFDANRDQITIRGEAAELPLANDFAEKLEKSLSDYDWAIPSPSPKAKTTRWEFTYVGTLKGDTQ